MSIYLVIHILLNMFFKILFFVDRLEVVGITRMSLLKPLQKTVFLQVNMEINKIVLLEPGLSMNQKKIFIGRVLLDLASFHTLGSLW